MGLSGFLLSWGIPKSMAFNSKIRSNDLDDLGYLHDLGNLHKPPYFIRVTSGLS